MKKYIKSARTSKSYTNKSKDSSTSTNNKFDDLQRGEIQKGQESGVDVSVYADPKFDWAQMQEIRKGLESGVDTSVYDDPTTFNGYQMLEIREGLEAGVDVSVYADPKFTVWRMREIRKGLESGVDVSVYADTKFDVNQMEQIRLGLKSGVDVNWYADPEFGSAQMDEIRKGLEQGFNVSLYADPKFNSFLMYDIRRGFEKYADDPLLDQTSVKDVAFAYTKKLPSLAYLSAENKYQRSKLNWQSVKDAVVSGQLLDVSALEEKFNLGTLEGRAAYTLGLNFDENKDGSITFTNNAGLEVGTLSSKEFDMLVRSAIVNSSTRQSFAKAFATQLKRFVVER